MSKHPLMGKLKVVHHLSVQSQECSKTPAGNNLTFFVVEQMDIDILLLFFSARLAVCLLSQSLSGQFPTSALLLLISVFMEETGIRK